MIIAVNFVQSFNEEFIGMNVSKKKFSVDIYFK